MWYGKWGKGTHTGKFMIPSAVPWSRTLVLFPARILAFYSHIGCGRVRYNFYPGSLNNTGAFCTEPVLWAVVAAVFSQCSRLEKGHTVISGPSRGLQSLRNTVEVFFRITKLIILLKGHVAEVKTGLAAVRERQSTWAEQQLWMWARLPLHNGNWNKPSWYTSKHYRLAFIPCFLFCVTGSLSISITLLSKSRCEQTTQ